MFCNGLKGGNFVFHKRGFLVISRRKSTSSRSGMKTESGETPMFNALSKKVGMSLICWASKVLTVRDLIWLF